jgi:hypothetical protein
MDAGAEHEVPPPAAMMGSTTSSLSLYLSVSLARARASGSTARPSRCRGALTTDAHSHATTPTPPPPRKHSRVALPHPQLTRAAPDPVRKPAVSTAVAPRGDRVVRRLGDGLCPQDRMTERSISAVLRPRYHARFHKGQG